ncbi:pentatricopeptide repeat-containing At3g23330, putative [Babesia ovata]|uniref:Pentatricopeptide repeat-containing At3g23330, putative n=1 Tax=Babesia ovata TaxID=189622 RepID=A0A2H6KI99_9APIC|nr:pentatricopeptide repeat-containing At3g23330, putative [Babesia ovata]GBE62722.1 pentatricopeptide repeat-containing At3g23330, putative [Babesia ovata]
MFMRALSEYHEVPTDDFVAYWALRTDNFAAFGDGAASSPRAADNAGNSATTTSGEADSAVKEKQGVKDFRYNSVAEEKPSFTRLAETITEYKLVSDSNRADNITTPCMLRHDSSGDLLSETSREESDITSEAGSSSKDEVGVMQLQDNPRVQNSIFYDGDLTAFLQRQKLLYRVIEDLQTSLFVSKPSVDFVPKINLASIESEYIVVDKKLLGTRVPQQSVSQPIRRPLGDDGNAPSKRSCAQGNERRTLCPSQYTLDRVLKKCADCVPDDRLAKSVHLQKLINILGGKNPAESYANEVLDGIYYVKSICAKTQADFGPGAFYSPSLRHPIDCLTETSSKSSAVLDKKVFSDNTLYSPQTAYMIPKNINVQLAKQKDEALNGSDEEASSRLRVPRMSNSKLAHFVESLCGVDFDQKVIQNSLEQNSKECCDLRSLIQLCQRESEGEAEGDSEATAAPNEYFSNTSNHVGHIDGFSTAPVTYYKNRILPNNAMEFYHNTTNCDYKKEGMVRMQGDGPLDVSLDTFTTFDNRRQNLSHYLEAISTLDGRIREIQQRSEKMHRALHQYSQREHTDSVNDLQEVINLETLLFVCDTLMETKRRLHDELRRRVQDELDMINHILPEPLADSLTRILYPSMNS